MLTLGEAAGRVQVEANSSVEVEGQQGQAEEKPPALDLRMGNVWVEAKGPTMQVKSPLVQVTASEGAIYRLRVVLNATTTVSAYRGTVWVKPLGEAGEGRVMLMPGDEVKVFPSGRVAIGKLDPEDAPPPEGK